MTIQSILGVAVRVESVEFLSDRTTVRGEVFRPEQARESELPGVVLGHGWGMTAGGNLTDFARAIAASGIAAMTIDFRNLGRSDGEPRQDINPYQQIEDFRNAVAFLGTLEGVDANRIGVWGSSYAGGHALVVAATDPAVKCVVAQVPTIDGARAAEIALRPKAIANQSVRYAEDRLSILRGEAPAMATSVAEDKSTWAVFPGRDAFDYMTSDGERSTTWRNETTLRSLDLARSYIPGAHIRWIAPKPLLMIIADHDTTTPTSLQLDAYAEAREPKSLVIIHGGHYAPYTSEFERASGAAVTWFLEHL